MRDLLLLSFIGVCLIWSLRKPWIGVIMWTWVSLMNPHGQFSWRAANMPVATAVAAVTLIGLMYTREKQNPFVGPPVWGLLAFTIWLCITLPFSFYVQESMALWERSMKIFFMIFVTLALLDTRKKLDAFIWIMVISIGFYGIKGGIFTVLTGGNFRVWGPGGFIGGNNEIALALVTTIPLMRYLQLQMTKVWYRRAMWAAMLLTAITVLGTYSRGALLGITAMTFFIWLKSDKKVVGGVALLILGAMALSFMPDQWWERMDTIQTYDSDESALGRINAWWMAWNLACNKLFGGGFEIYSAQIFAMYSPNPKLVHAAHSIYFQVLGEHGFIGLFLFLLVGVLTWSSSRKLIKQAGRDPTKKWAADLGAMIQVSMVGYATGGAFLSLAYFDLPYNLMVAAVLALRILVPVKPVKAPLSADAIALGRRAGTLPAEVPMSKAG